jgi:hypothetical protein
LWAEFLSWLEANRVGDLTGIVGIAISLIGFGLTALGVMRSRRAAERAEEAARAARDSIQLFDTVVDFSAAISILEEIKRAHRHELWVLLPDRYAAIRKLLISLRTSNVDLSNDQKSAIQSVLVNLHDIERAVERGLQNPSNLKAAKFNSLLSDDIDNLVTVLAELKAAKTGV